MRLRNGLFALLFLTTSLFSVGFDKTQHMQVSMALGYAGATLLNEYGSDSKTKKILYATGVSFAVGLGKEFYDQYDYGGFSEKDLVADLTGAVSGAVLSSYLDKKYFLIIERKKERKSAKIILGRKF